MEMPVFVLLVIFGFLSLAVWLDYRKDIMKIKTGRTNMFDRLFGVGSLDMDADMEDGSSLRREVEELRQHNKQLAERVEVLERIVTDSGFELQEQIRKL